MANRQKPIRTVSRKRRRPLREIAEEIWLTWGVDKVSPAAKPYLRAMGNLDTVDDMFGLDDGRTVVLYFLSNAGRFSGQDAAEIKAELKAMVKR